MWKEETTMKKRVAHVLGIMLAVAMLTGCGGKDGAAPSGNTEGSGQADSAVTATDSGQSAEQESPEVTVDSGQDPEQDGAGTATDPEQGDKQTGGEGSQEAGGQISEEKAKKIALKDAGVTEDELSGLRIKLEQDDGVQKYEVEFYVGNKEYDYDIDAASGEIRSKDTEIEDDFRDGTASGVSLSEKEAIRIALKKVPGATKKDVNIHLDKEDGRQVYEGEIHYKTWEYEFEIDAENGKILSWDKESIYDD